MIRFSSIVLSSFSVMFAGCAAQVAPPIPTSSAPVGGRGESTASRAQLTRYAPLASDPTRAARFEGSTTLDVETNLGRLRALQVFEVLGQIQHIPESHNCYVEPCAVSASEVAAAQEADARALGELTAKVIAASELALPAVAPTAEQDQANLETIRALSIVDVGALLVEEPKITGHCYGACPADAAAAAEVQRIREGKLANIARAVSVAAK